MPAKKKKEQKRKEAAKQRQQKKLQTKSDEKTADDVETDAAVKDIWDTGDGAQQVNETTSGAEGHQYDQKDRFSPDTLALTGSQQALKNYHQDPGYKNYLKAGLCFYILKEVLEPCVEDVSKAIHRELMSLSKSCNCLHNARLCRNCEEKWKAKIQGFVAEGYIINWTKKDTALQPKQHWSVAKCFVEYDQTDKDSASECDISPLLTFIVNCNRFKEEEFGHIQEGARKVRKDRNQYIHRGTPKISNKELQDIKKNMINFLQNQKLKATGKADEAQKVIEKVCDVNYIIFLEDEVKAELSCLHGRVDLIHSLYSNNPQIKSWEGKVSDLGQKLKVLDEKEADESEFGKLRQEIAKNGDSLKELEQRVTTLKGQVDKIEKQQSSHHRTSEEDMSETPRERRPETDGLRQLKKRPSMLSGSSHHEHEDVKFTYEDLTHLKEIISAGPDNEEAVEIVDTIKEQDDKRLKTELFQYLAGLLRNEIVSREKHANIRIWPGTTILPTEEIKFVCLYKGKFETQLPRFFGIDIHYKDMDMPEPLIDIENRDLPNWEMTTDQDASLLQSAIEEHGDTLFKEHSNLQVICGGPFLLRNGRVLKQNTIILYCHVKGIIPYGEETFPSLLNFNGIDIPVDIREGHFVLAVGRQEWHEKLCMGISIGEKGVGWAGTLGPFVNLGCNEYGFLTCAHVVGDVGTEVVQPSKGDSKGQKSENETICGTVVKRVFDPEFSDRMNGLTKTGVDAALVKFNKDRGIEATNFPEVQEADLNLIGFAPETKFHYVGGGIGCQRESVKARGKMVIKYGRTTGLRRGVMVLEGAMVKIDDPELYYNEWNSTFTMKGQYLVDGIARYQFAEPGDSGAGVFTLDDENKLTLIGLVTGILDARFDHRCVVTPIEHILTALELPADDLKFHENIEID